MNPQLLWNWADILLDSLLQTCFVGIMNDCRQRVSGCENKFSNVKKKKCPVNTFGLTENFGEQQSCFQTFLWFLKKIYLTLKIVSVCEALGSILGTVKLIFKKVLFNNVVISMIINSEVPAQFEFFWLWYPQYHK